MQHNTLILRAVTLLLLALGAAPLVQAQTYQYNVFVKGFKPKTATIGAGAGDVSIDPNNPTGSTTSAPDLVVSSPRVVFQGTSDGTSTTSGTTTTGLVTQSGVSKTTRVAAASTATTITAPLSAAQKVTLTNQGTATAVLAGFSPVDGFNVESDCPLQLGAGQACELTITTQLSKPGIIGGVLNINVVGYPGAALALQATIPEGPQPILSFDRKSLDFGTIESALPAALTTTLSNTGTATGNLTGLAVAEPFSMTSDCGSSLAAGASCNVSVSLNSLIAKRVTGALTLPQAGINPLVVGLTANVTPPLTTNLQVDPDLVKLGDLSSTKAVAGSATVTNSGGIPAALLPIQSSSDFEITTDCGSSLEAGAQCTINGQFVNTAVGGYTLPLVIGKNDTSPVVVKFTASVSDPTGKSANLRFAPSDLVFGLVSVGSPQVLTSTLSNTGGKAAQLTSISLGGSGTEFTQTNNCPEVLEPGMSCDVAVTVTPSAKNVISGMLSVVSDSGTQTQLQLSAAGGFAQLSAPATVDFGTVLGNGGSTVRPVVLSNRGSYAISGLSLGSISGPFTVVSSTCATTIDPKKACSLVVSFAPNGSGAQTGSLSVTSDNGGQATVALTGAGTLSQLQFSATDMTFPDTAVGKHFTQNVTLSNSGPDDATLTGIGVFDGKTDYAQSNNCGTLLKGGAQCQVAVQFTPSDVGLRQGGLGVTTAYADPLQINLAGTGFSQKLLVAPATLSFGEVRVGTTSDAQTFLISNPSPSAATLTGVSVTAAPAIFNLSSNCGASLASGDACTASVTSAPSAAGAVSGKIEVVSSFGTYSVNPSVTGTIPKGTLDVDQTGGGGGSGTAGGPNIIFDPTPIGSTSPVRTVTFSNSGTGPLTITGISVTSGIGVFGQSNNCGASLAPGQACKISLAYSPVSSGTSTGSLAILTSDGPYTVTLSGTASTVSGSWAGTSDFGQIAVGSSAQQSYSFTNTGSGPMTITTVLQGNDVSFVLNNCGTAGAPVTLNKGDKCAAIVQYTPSAYPSALTGAMLSTTADGMAKAATFSLTGMATGYQLAFQAAPDVGNFGTVQTGGTITRNITLTNKSKLSDTLSGAPTITGAGYSIASNSCTDGKALASGQSCVITVALNIPTPSEPGNYTAEGSLTVNSSHGVSAVLPLTAAYQQVAMPLVWVPDAASFPTPPQGGGNVSMNYWLTNKLTVSQKLGGTPYFSSNDSRFTATTSCSGTTILSANGGRCAMTVSLKIPAGVDAGDYSFQGTLTAFKADGTPVSLDISVPFTQAPYTFAWDRGVTDFGTLAPGTNKNVSVYLRNTSPMTVTSSMLPTLEGDSVFKFYNPSGCAVGATATANSTMCYRIITATMPAGQPPGEYHYSATLTGGIKEGNQQDSVSVTATMVQEQYTLSLTGNGDFGSAKAGTNVSRTITLKNTTVASPQSGLKVSYSNPQFTTYTTSCTGTLSVGGSCTYTVYGKGISGTTQTGDMTVTSTQGGSVTIPLSITSP